MRKIRTLIVAEDPLARDALRMVLRADVDIELVADYEGGQEALASIRALHPDLVFLDVQNPQFSGFEWFTGLPTSEQPQVIVLSADERDAARAFDIGAIDYLLKPFEEARVAQALQRGKGAVWREAIGSMSAQLEQLLDYVRRLESGAGVQTPPRHVVRPSGIPEYTDRVVLKADGALHFIRSQDVIWLEAQGDFVKVQATNGRTQLVRETLQSMEQKLDASQFLRIHRSYVVNLDHVKRVETALYGDYFVYMSDATKLRLSRNYRAKLKALVRKKN